MNMRNIVIIGAGGFASEAAWVLEEMNNQIKQWNILGCTEDVSDKKGGNVYGYPVLGKIEEVSANYCGQELWFFCAIGNNDVREKVVGQVLGFGWKAATLMHPSVIIAKNAEIGEGTYIGANSVICPNVKVGKFVLFNAQSTAGHDAVLEDFSQICPGVQVSGFCKVGRGAFIGSNAAIYPGKKVGAWAKVGSNSQVILNVREKTTVNGVPAVEILQNTK